MKTNAFFLFSLCVLSVSAVAFSENLLDTFGIAKFYPTKSGTREWNSAHWSNGIPRTFKYAPDQYDPTGWTEDHSSGSDGFNVDGAGMMRMSGSGPRFHVNSLITAKVPPRNSAISSSPPITGVTALRAPTGAA